MTRHLRVAGPCPEAWRHTPMPENYAAIAGWMQVLSRTHQQSACPRCGRFLVWTLRTDSKAGTS